MTVTMDLDAATRSAVRAIQQRDEAISARISLTKQLDAARAALQAVKALADETDASIPAMGLLRVSDLRIALNVGQGEL